MSDHRTDPRSTPESGDGRDAVEGSDAAVPRPANDEATVELVRDAIGVARGELSDERFSEKYGIAEEPSGERDRASAADGYRHDR
jgi:hypothetical protein